jgi:methyl-accepting chemotaxis protein
MSQEGVIAPLFLVKAAAPILDNEQQSGTIIATYIIDSAFLTGIKSKTGLESSLYVNDTLIATSLEQRTPLLGITETNKNILTTVLTKQQPYAGTARINNSTYLSSYIPLNDSNDLAIGMLSVNKPEQRILETSQRSIQLTFLFTSLLIAASLIPSYLIGTMIRRQIK